MEKEQEIRSLNTEDVNVTNENDEYIISGYINKYGKRSQFMGFFEEVRAGAFDNSLKNKDFIPALLNHDREKILGSTRSGSLELESDNIGLKYTLRINPNVSYAKDTYELVKAGDISGCSFGFRCNDDEWSTLEDGTDLRTIKDLDLCEVTITPYPAYADSEASCRSYDKYKQTSVDEELRIKKLKFELELM